MVPTTPIGSLSYRQAWLLGDALNQTFRQLVIRTRDGGDADLTEFGITLVASYRAMEQKTRQILARRIVELEQALAPT